MMFKLPTWFFMLFLIRLINQQPVVVTHDEMKEIGPPADRITEKNLAISSGLAWSAYMYVNHRGNGFFEFGNIVFRAYDAHGDTRIFQDYLLNIKLIDINGDGYRDLVVYGMEEFLSDDVWWEKIGEGGVFFLFLFLPDVNEFELTYSNISPAGYENFLPFCDIVGRRIRKRDTDALPSVHVRELKEEDSKAPI